MWRIPDEKIGTRLHALRRRTNCDNLDASLTRLLELFHEFGSWCGGYDPVGLFGDGVVEVLVVAERLQGGGLAGAQAGDYSIVYLRKVIGNEVQQLVLHHSTLQNLAPDEFGYLEAFRVPTVADLDGDGQMEIVTQGFYYEGSWTEMWEYLENGQGGAVAALSVGCGV